MKDRNQSFESGILSKLSRKLKQKIQSPKCDSSGDGKIKEYIFLSFLSSNSVLNVKYQDQTMSVIHRVIEGHQLSVDYNITWSAVSFKDVIQCQWSGGKF